MTWPLPQPADIQDRAAAVYESTPKLAGCNAREPNSVLGATTRVVGMAAFDLYVFQQRRAKEQMPDTAIDWLPYHANVWGVPRIQAKQAFGNAIAVATAPMVIPAGLQMTAPGGAVYQTTAAVTIGSGLSASAPIQALLAGSAGSLAPGVILTLVSPLAGLSPQQMTVDSNGLIGTDIEKIDNWRSRVLARIRQRGKGGNEADYEEWAGEVIPGCIVKATTPGLGAVTVALAIPVPGSIPRVPTGPEIAAVQAYLSDPTRKPITAQVNVIAAALAPVNITLHMVPDTSNNRAATLAALALFFSTDAAIGGAIDVSRLDNAISVGSGEYNHDRSAPSADVAGVLNTLPVLGTVTWV